MSRWSMIAMSPRSMRLTSRLVRLPRRAVPRTSRRGIGVGAGWGAVRATATGSVYALVPRPLPGASRVSGRFQQLASVLAGGAVGLVSAQHAHQLADHLARRQRRHPGPGGLVVLVL